MHQDEVRRRLRSERSEVETLLNRTDAAGDADRASERETGDEMDPAQALTAQGVDDAVAGSLRARLAALDRSLARLEAGTYGLSVRSGVPIPDARLEADPAAELTVEEADDDRPQPS
jgi:DnaK suppressor protein